MRPLGIPPLGAAVPFVALIGKKEGVWPELLGSDTVDKIVAHVSELAGWPQVTGHPQPVGASDDSLSQKAAYVLDLAIRDKSRSRLAAILTDYPIEDGCLPSLAPFFTSVHYRGDEQSKGLIGRFGTIPVFAYGEQGELYYFSNPLASGNGVKI